MVLSSTPSCWIIVSPPLSSPHGLCYQLSKWLFWLELLDSMLLFHCFHVFSSSFCGLWLWKSSKLLPFFLFCFFHSDRCISAHMHACVQTLSGFLPEARGPCEDRAVNSVELSSTRRASESLGGEQTSCMRTEGSTRHKVHNI